ncbi:hypothetical protein ASG17_06280 [Brevundimonas sp. Leaf363]|uniref:hypothetical protein n=1 Tax=Brevundimonas sp. Leaf363 TaxID=1736353 RepID=UPI0007012F98|nr:hypothetical protein [Brevundimonas sp. Leaf363]KQS55671.1 hypothetical protein ASG17_06280 [Brevundimonas sp. Leaf363]
MREPVHRRLGLKATTRLWLSASRESLGLPIALSGTVFVLALLWITLDPHYPAQPVTGRVAGLTVTQQGKSVIAAAKVDVDGSSVVVPVPLHYGCDIGDPVRLQKLGLRWGYTYTLDTTRPACR